MQLRKKKKKYINFIIFHALPLHTFPNAKKPLMTLYIHITKESHTKSTFLLFPFFWGGGEGSSMPMIAGSEVANALKTHYENKELLPLNQGMIPRMQGWKDRWMDGRE